MLIVAFLFWGFGDVFKSKPKNYALKVANIEYSWQQWNEIVHNNVQDIKIKYGQNLSPEELNQLKKHVTEQIINSALLYTEAQNLGITASDNMIKKEILKIPIFFKDGQFNKELFEQTIKSYGLSEEAFIEKIKEDLIRNVFLSSLAGNKIIVPTLGKIILQNVLQSREVDVIKIPFSSFNIPSVAQEDQLMTLYEKNKNEFKQPEIRKVSYAVISLDSIQNKNITVDEQELKNIYKQKSFLFITPEKRVVKQVRFDSLSQAKKAEAELRRGDDFELVAKKYSPQFEKINLGVITVKDFEGDLSDKLFKLKSEEISDITETPLGLYIFKIDKIIPSKTKKYSEVKDLIQKEYLKEAQFNEFLQLVKKIQKELESGVNIELIAKKYNLKIKHTKVTSSANNENNISSFVTMAFKTALNAQSNLFPIDGENFCTLRVDDIIPEKIMDFSNVKNKIQKIWRNEEIIKKAKSLSFTAGKNYNSLRNAKLINFQNVKTEKISIAMSDSKQELPFDFTKKLFDLPDKGVTEPYIDYLNNEVLFGIIVKTKLPDKTTIYRYKQLYESQIYQIEQEAMLAELLGNLRGKHEIYIDPDLFF